MRIIDRLRLLIHNFEADIEFDVVPDDVAAIKTLLMFVEWAEAHSDPLTVLEARKALDRASGSQGR